MMQLHHFRSNPFGDVSEGGTEGDSSGTDPEQKRHNSLGYKELSAESRRQEETETEHSSDTSDTPKCVTSVSSSDAPLADLPPVMAAALRSWHRLPEHVRQTIETLLRAEGNSGEY